MRKIYNMNPSFPVNPSNVRRQFESSMGVADSINKIKIKKFNFSIANVS